MYVHINNVKHILPNLCLLSCCLLVIDILADRCLALLKPAVVRAWPGFTLKSAALSVFAYVDGGDPSLSSCDMLVGSSTKSRSRTRTRHSSVGFRDFK